MSQNVCDQSGTKPFIKLRSGSGSENVHYNALYEDLPEEFELIAKEEINESEENRVKGLERLKKFAEREHIPVIPDHRLLSILRYCKYDMKKSETKLKTYLVRRREMKNFLKEIEPEEIQKIIDDLPFAILPYRDKHGRPIVCTLPYNMDFEQHHEYDICTVALSAGLLLLEYPMTTVAGINYFAECKIPSLYLFFPIFKTLKKFLPYLLTSFPFRIGRIECINENPMIRWFQKVMRPFVSKKVLDKLHFHGDSYEHLKKLYDPDILPEELGGNLGPLNNTFYKEKLLAYIRDLVEEDI